MQDTENIAKSAAGIAGSGLALAGIGLGFRKLGNDWAEESLRGDKIRVDRFKFEEENREILDKIKDQSVLRRLGRKVGEIIESLDAQSSPGLFDEKDNLLHSAAIGMLGASATVLN